MLKFSRGNAKLNNNKYVIYTFSLPAGWTCPGAFECKSKVHIKEDRRVIKDGKDTEFRCFAASQEVLFPSVYNARQFNLAALRKAKGIAAKFRLINTSLPSSAYFVRTHVSGDFFSQEYFDAWMRVAEANPHINFYAYTKSLSYWVKRIDSIPSNFTLTASYGGKQDGLIDRYSLRSAKVVFSKEEAAKLNLEIDHDDSLAMSGKDNFALLLHGTQPKDSEASKAWQKIKRAGGGYGKGRKLKVV